jgi:Fe-S cluster assembly protein SufB
VVELTLDDAEIKYSPWNWYPGDKNGKGGIYNFVTKRPRRGHNSKISWTQVEPARPSPGNTRAASCGDTTRAASSIHAVPGYQQVDSGTR